jgi:hypothetical protein
MRKIIVGAQVSMDGVMQAPGSPWEDPTKDALLYNDLVDGSSIFTVPVVLGGGKKLFADGSVRPTAISSPDHASRATVC